jgi:ankyrin repeat protein
MPKSFVLNDAPPALRSLAQSHLNKLLRRCIFNNEHHLTRKRQTQIVQKLLKWGANPLDDPNDFLNPFDWSFICSYDNIWPHLLPHLPSATAEHLAGVLTSVQSISSSDPDNAAKQRASRHRRSRALLIAAGDLASEVLALALAKSLRHNISFHGDFLLDEVDFSRPAPQGFSWLGLLASAQFLDPATQSKAQSIWTDLWRSSDPADATLLDAQGLGCLHRAAAAGNMHALACMDGFADLWAPDAKGLTPLQWAAKERQQEAFDFLLARMDFSHPSRAGAWHLTMRELREPDRSRRLHWNSPPRPFDWHRAAVDLAQAIDPLALNELGQAPCDIATFYRFEPAADILRRRRDQQLALGRPFFSIRATATSRDDALLKFIFSMLDCRSSIHHPDQIIALARQLSHVDACHSQSGWSALTAAAAQNENEVVRALLALGANPDWSHPKVGSALSMACSHANHMLQGDDHIANFDALATPTSAQFLDKEGRDALDWLLCDKNSPAWAIEKVALLCDLNSRGSHYLLLAANQYDPQAFKHFWRVACPAGQGLAPWALAPNADEAHWPEALARAGRVDELLAAHQAGAFGPDGMASRKTQGRHMLSWTCESNAKASDIEKLLPLNDPRHVDPLGRDCLMVALEFQNPSAALALMPWSDPLALDLFHQSALDKARMWNVEEAIAPLEKLTTAAKQRLALGKSARQAKARAPQCRL